MHSEAMQHDSEGLATGYFGVITITDTGHGIPQELQSRVFQPFFTTKEEGSGAGIGLSTVMQVVNKYHGSASFESSAGVGTSFTIMLPLADIN